LQIDSTFRSRPSGCLTAVVSLRSAADVRLQIQEMGWRHLQGADLEIGEPGCNFPLAWG